MNIYAITSDNTVLRTSRTIGIPEGAVVCGTEQELAAAAESWPMTRLVALWNGLPGVRPVSKFTDRKTAVQRLWRAMESLPQPETNKGKGRRRGARQEPRHTKADRILELLRQPAGVTLAGLMEATEWQAHSVRGFLSGHVSKKLGLPVQSTRGDGERVYSIAG